MGDKLYKKMKLRREVVTYGSDWLAEVNSLLRTGWKRVSYALLSGYTVWLLEHPTETVEVEIDPKGVTVGY